MKAKLLKKLRKQFKIEYYPSTKQYKVSCIEVTYHNDLRKAKATLECGILNYGRKYYEKYSKRILIK